MKVQEEITILQTYQLAIALVLLTNGLLRQISIGYIATRRLNEIIPSIQKGVECGISVRHQSQACGGRLLYCLQV